MKPPLKKPLSYSLAEIAEAYGVSVVFLRKEIARGHLEAFRFGLGYEVSPDAIERWYAELQERQQTPKKQIAKRNPKRFKPSAEAADIRQQLGLPN